MGSGKSKQRKKVIQDGKQNLKIGKHKNTRAINETDEQEINGFEYCLMIANIREVIVKYLNMVDRSMLAQVSSSLNTSCGYCAFEPQELDFTGEGRLKNNNFLNYLSILEKSQLRRMTSLNLIGTKVKCKGIEKILPKLRSIEVLELGEGQVSKNLIKIASIFCSQLIEFKLFQTTFVNIHTIAFIAEHLLFLEHLYMPFSKNLDDRCLKMIARNMKRLRRISIRGCPNVSDEGLERLIVGCRRLRFLDVSNTNMMAYTTCAKIGRTGLKLGMLVATDTRMSECGCQLISMKLEQRERNRGRIFSVYEPCKLNRWNKDERLRRAQLEKKQRRKVKKQTRD